MATSRIPQHTDNQAIEIVVYTKSDNSESRYLKRVLQKNNYNFVEVDGGRADVVLGLQKRLGHLVEIPGLLVDGKEWISESPEQSWTDGLEKYCLSKLLNSTNDPPGLSSSDEIAFRPLASPQHDSPCERRVPLPNGTTKTVVQLTNELVQHHKYDGMIFEGDRAIDVYKRHYGARNDDQAIRFGYNLVGYGILVIVTSDAAGFGDSQVRLFATQEGLNTIVAWPGRKITRLGESLRLLQSILRTISKVDHPGDPQRRLKLLQQIDFDVCTLQACTLHKASALFLLQLFNVLMRHYGATHALPTTLPEILQLQSKIGYRIDGHFVTAADLRTWLLVGSSGAKIPPVHTIGKKRNMIRMLRCAKVTEDEEEKPRQHYFATPSSSPWIATDNRLIFAMAWTAGMGTLEASLDQIVSVYCQTNIAIHNNTVFLPPLLQWFQNDFGKTPEVIVKRLQQYLPIGHRLRIQSLYEEGNLQVKFRSHHVGGSLSNPVDLDEERTAGDQSSCRLSCYLDGATVSENNTMSAMSIFSAGLQSRPGSGRMGSNSFMKSMSVVSMGAGRDDEMGKVPESTSDGDTTRSTTSASTEDQNRDDYASWFKSDMSMITYGSDFDVLVNEAYFNGGEVESQRDPSLIS